MVVTAEVLDGPHNAVFDQAEIPLHSENAILYILLGMPAEGSKEGQI
jgi:ornithine carbamoyltransferase